MKKVFTRSSVVPCDLARSVLEAAGIFAVIRHELGSAAAGEGFPVPGNPSLPWAWPEVLVSDEDYERALEILSAVDTTSGDTTSGDTTGEDLPPPPVSPPRF